MKYKLRTIRSHLLVSAMIVIALDVYGLLLLIESGVVGRFVFVEDIVSVSPQPEWRNTKERPSASFVSEFPETDPLDLMESLMNKVNKIEANSGLNSASYLFDRVKGGHGLVCSGMAIIFKHILSEKEFMVRLVALRRTLGGRDATHTNVEILLNDKWVIFDPTFNVTFEKDGRLIGAQDIHRALLDGSFNEVRPVFHGEVAYPARLKKYYMHYLSLYNNVLIVERAKSIWHRLPPFGYWMGEKYYVQIEKELGQKNEHMYFFNNLNLFFVVLLPTMFISLLLLAAVLSISFKRKL